MNHLLLICVACMGAGLGAIILIFNKKRTDHFYQLFQEGTTCENNGDYIGALDVYILLVEESKKMAFKDKLLIQQAEERIKALRTKLEEQRNNLQKPPINPKYTKAG